MTALDSALEKFDMMELGGYCSPMPGQNFDMILHL